MKLPRSVHIPKFFYKIGMRICILVFISGFCGCMTNRPLVKGFFEEDGIIYRDREQEEWGSRSRVVIRPVEF